MKILTMVVLLTGLALAGCGEQQQIVIKTQYKALAIPEQFYHCPQDAMAKVGIKSVADVNNLMDSQVARLTAQLSKNNKECGNSIRAIKAYLNSAQVQKGKPQKK